MIYAIIALFCICAVEGFAIVLLWHETKKISADTGKKIKKAVESAISANSLTEQKVTGQLEAFRKEAKSFKTALHACMQNQKELAARVNDLESGIAPDYEKAKEAAQWLDRFNESVTGYLSYDPLAAIRDRKEGS